MFSYCDKCGDDNLTDLPVCAACASTVHFTHRPCRCADCVAAHDQAEQADTPMLKLVQNDAATVRWSNDRYAEAAKAAGGVLVIKREAA
jgi:predicted amidophosphoribosyltransferase